MSDAPTLMRPPAAPPAPQHRRTTTTGRMKPAALLVRALCVIGSAKVGPSRTVNVSSVSPILGTLLRVEVVYTLTLPSRADRREVLDRQLRHMPHLRGVEHHYVNGSMPGRDACGEGRECVILSWINMLERCARYPALFTEDDIDLTHQYDPQRMSPRGNSVGHGVKHGVYSLGSDNCFGGNCTHPRWTVPHRTAPRTHGMLAMYVTDAHAARKFVAWVKSNRTRKYPHIDAKLYLGGMPEVRVLCPPLFWWRSSRSDVIYAQRPQKRKRTCAAWEASHATARSSPGTRSAAT